MNYKLIALDLDGTLCNDEKAVTPKTRRPGFRKTASRTFPGNARH